MQNSLVLFNVGMSAIALGCYYQQLNEKTSDENILLKNIGAAALSAIIQSTKSLTEATVKRAVGNTLGNVFYNVSPCVINVLAYNNTKTGVDDEVKGVLAIWDLIFSLGQPIVENLVSKVILTKEEKLLRKISFMRISSLSEHDANYVNKGLNIYLNDPFLFKGESKIKEDFISLYPQVQERDKLYAELVAVYLKEKNIKKARQVIEKMALRYGTPEYLSVLDSFTDYYKEWEKQFNLASSDSFSQTTDTFKKTLSEGLEIVKSLSDLTEDCSYFESIITICVRKGLVDQVNVLLKEAEEFICKTKVSIRALGYIVLYDTCKQANKDSKAFDLPAQKYLSNAQDILENSKDLNENVFKCHMQLVRKMILHKENQDVVKWIEKAREINEKNLRALASETYIDIHSIYWRLHKLYDIGEFFLEVNEPGKAKSCMVEIKRSIDELVKMNFKKDDITSFKDKVNSLETTADKRIAYKTQNVGAN